MSLYKTIKENTRVKGVCGSVWVEFVQTQDSNHIGYSSLREVK